MKISILTYLQIADFGNQLLSFAIILLIAPYLPPWNLIIFKIPKYPPKVKKILKVIGPIALLFAILVRLPIIKQGNVVVENSMTVGDCLSSIQPYNPLMQNQTSICSSTPKDTKVKKEHPGEVVDAKYMLRWSVYDSSKQVIADCKCYN